MDQIEEMYLEEPDASCEYYCFSLLGNPDGPSTTVCRSHWIGFSDGDPPRDIRVASIVKPDEMIGLLKSIGEPPVIVRDQNAFRMWYLWGGHAIIEKSVAESNFPDWMKGREIIHVVDEGMVDVASVDPTLLRRAPTRRLRMDVFDRDSRRCMICGQRPSENVHVELEAHHLRPWARGGATEKNNLITLCSACHDALKPHEDFRLWELIGQSPIPIKAIKRDYFEKLKQHQARVQSLIKKIQAKERKRGTSKT